ncbi:type III secretion system protein PrgJ, partial [Citrobacter freundii]
MGMFINQISPQSLQAPIFSESQPSLVTGDLIDLDTRLAEEVSRLAAGTQVEKDRITAALNN